MSKKQDLKKLVEILKETFSEEELRELKEFLVRVADALVEAYLYGDFS